MAVMPNMDFAEFASVVTLCSPVAVSGIIWTYKAGIAVWANVDDS